MWRWALPTAIGCTGSIHRVIKPDGLLAIYDIVAGEGGPVVFPVPWARTADISFLLKPGCDEGSFGEKRVRGIYLGGQNGCGPAMAE